MKARNTVLGTFGLPASRRARAADLRAAGAAVLMFTLATSWLLTTWFAYRAGYPAALGRPLFSWSTWQFYAPWQWLLWRGSLATYAPQHPLVSSSLELGRLIVPFALLLGLFVLRARSAKRANRQAELHGSAHWATPEEVAATNLLGHDHGIVCGMWHDPRTDTLRYLRHRGVEHVLTVAPTRSGKDKGIVTPTVLTLGGSMIITDPAGETYEETAGYLHSIGYRVLRFEPSAPPGETVRINPLAEVRLGTHRERADALDIATSWLNEDGKAFEGENSIFAKSARPLIAAAILHVLYREKLLNHPTAHLGHVFYEISPPNRSIQDVLDQWATFPHDPTSERKWRLPDGTPTRTHPLIASVAMNLLGLAPETLASIVLSATAALAVLYDDCIEENLSTSDFRIDHLANGAQPTALYLVYPPDVVDRLAPVMRTLLEMTFHRLCERTEYRGGRARSPHAHSVYAVLNEFPAFGRMPVLEKALPVCAKYGVTVMIFTQDFQQMRALYGGENESITPQCRLRIIYAPNRFETAKLVSDMLGATTAIKTAESESQQGGSFGVSARGSISEHEIERPLLRPDEVMRIPGAVRDANDENVKEPGLHVVIKTGHAPILCTNVFYWQDAELARRASLRPPPAGMKARIAASAAPPAARLAPREPVAPVAHAEVPLPHEAPVNVAPGRAEYEAEAEAEAVEADDMGDVDDAEAMARAASDYAMLRDDA